MPQSMEDMLLTLVARGPFRKPKKAPGVPGPEFISQTDTAGVSTPANPLGINPGMGTKAPGTPQVFPPDPSASPTNLFGPEGVGALFGGTAPPPTGNVGPVGEAELGGMGPNNFNLTGPGGSNLGDDGGGEEGDRALVTRLLRAMLTLNPGDQAAISSVLTSAAGISMDQTLQFGGTESDAGSLFTDSLARMASGGDFISDEPFP